MKVTQLPASSYKTPYKRSHMSNSSVLPDIKTILQGFEKDDYIILAIILVLIFEGCEDYVLLAALGYLFIMGFK